MDAYCHVIIVQELSLCTLYHKTAKKLPKNEPQGAAGAGGRARGGVDLQEAAPQGRSGQCCGGSN